MAFFRRNRQIISLTLIVFLLTGFVTFSARDRVTQTFIELWIQRTVAPIQRATAFVVYQGRSFGRYLAELGALRRDNEALRIEIDSLRYQYNLLIEASRESTRLRELLDYRSENTDLDLIMARIISRGLTSWQHEIVIDRGTKHGVRLRDPVVSHAGAVGRVVQVGPTSARVLLITDPRSGLAARVQETREGGVVEGDPANPGLLRMANLPHDLYIEPGAQVVTSGLGGIFPGDNPFLVGTVLSVSTSPDGLVQTVSVQPTVDFWRLEEVLVLRMWRDD
jgi:rod shape-determining protein MreC